MFDRIALLAAIMQHVAEKPVGVGTVWPQGDGLTACQQRIVKTPVHKMHVTENHMRLTVGIFHANRFFRPFTGKRQRLLRVIPPSLERVEPMAHGRPCSAYRDIGLLLVDDLEKRTGAKDCILAQLEEFLHASVKELKRVAIPQSLVPDRCLFATQQFYIQPRYNFLYDFILDLKTIVELAVVCLRPDGISMLAYMVMAISAGIGLIWRIKLSHAVAAGAAPLGAWFTFLALITGSIWGRPMWGTWWEWGDPRLTSELIMLFLYFGYMALRAAIDDTTKADKASAVLALVGAVNIAVSPRDGPW